MSYRLSNQTDKSADVINQDGKLLGHIERTEDQSSPWACLDSEGAYIQAHGNTPGQAAFKLVEYINGRRKKK